MFLFKKKIYNLACNLEKQKAGEIYKIGSDDLDKYNLIKCINDNINDNNSQINTVFRETLSYLSTFLNKIYGESNNISYKFISILKNLFKQK